MPKYVIEREIPNAGKLSQQELKAISQKSCGVLQKLGPQVQWVESYVADNKPFYVYLAKAKRLSASKRRSAAFQLRRSQK